MLLSELKEKLHSLADDRRARMPDELQNMSLTSFDNGYNLGRAHSYEDAIKIINYMMVDEDES